MSKFAGPFAMIIRDYRVSDAPELRRLAPAAYVVTDFPLCDQEILLRHLHMTAHQYVDRYKAALANGNGSASARSAATEKDEAHV